jgi:AcrR family transcriptional regulator
MARPTTIKDEEILRAAHEVFLARGISATTAEVAARAGVSEGTIFHRFKSKVELFFSAMDFGSQASDGLDPWLWLDDLEKRVGHGDVKEQLQELAHESLAFFRRMMPLMMMSWSNPGPSGVPEKLQVPNSPPLRALKRLSGYLEAEMRSGRLGRHDPEIVARTFMGSVSNYALFEIFMKASKELPLPPDTFVRGLVEILWSGIAPTPTKAGTARKRRHA